MVELAMSTPSLKCPTARVHIVLEEGEWMVVKSRLYEDRLQIWHRHPQTGLEWAVDRWWHPDIPNNTCRGCKMSPPDHLVFLRDLNNFDLREW